MFGRMLRMPGSTPVPALRALAGLIGMPWRIYQEKLLLILVIEEAEGTLVKKILKGQVEMGWPGLAREATQICSKIGLPDIITNKITKPEIKEAIFWSNYESLKDEMVPLKKLQRLVNENLTRPQ